MGSLRSPLLSLALAFALLAGGCAGSRIQYNSAEQAYKKGIAEYKDGDYDDAVTYFRAVFTYGRDNQWADDAQLYLARAYYEDRRYLLAASEYRRFAQLYRSDERASEAEYEQAVSYDRLSPAYNLDQTYTQKALSLFLLFSDRYPQHEKAAEVDAKIKELRSKLARKQLAAGRQYERRELWEAAAHAYESVFDQYPDTRWVDDALLGAVRTNVIYAERSIQKRKAERYRRATQNFRNLQQIFPDSPLLDDARPHYETATRRLGDLGEDTDDAFADTGR